LSIIAAIAESYHATSHHSPGDAGGLTVEDAFLAQP
jgi:hypothetical protein